MKKILILLIVLLVFSFGSKVTNAFGECDQYGYMTMYDSFTRTCSCMSGYSFGKDFLGNTSCVSDDQLCKDQYGYNASSDYLSGKCKCGYGYVFGKDYVGRTQCVSADSVCSDQLGYNSSYNSLSGNCECSYGYIISGGSCVNANNFCSSAHGIYSSYDRLDKSCECDSGYTLDNSSQCVKKQNNVYFTLKEINTDDKKAIIKSDYDYRYYLITYNYGCYATSFKRYLNHQIVVNLGTDYDLDTWDKIVLQDDDETCDITHKEYANSDTTLEPVEEVSYFSYTPPVVNKPVAEIPKVKTITEVKEVKSKSDPISSASKTIASSSMATTSSSTQIIVKDENKKTFFQRISAWYKNLFN